MSRLEKQICNIYDLLMIAKHPKVRKTSLLLLLSMMERRKALSAATGKA